MILQEFFRRFHDLRYAIRDRYEVEEAASISQLWLAHITGISWNAWLLRPDRAWDPAWDAAYQHGLEQLSAGIPVQHLMGHTEFYGRPFIVGPEVLIPRQETEELVHWAMETVKAEPGKPIRLLDIGTGSGCIAVTLVCEWHKKNRTTEAWALDVSEDAIAMAQQNAEAQQAEVQFLQRDIFQSREEDFQGLDLVISNPPYVTNEDRQDMAALVLDHDPALALFAPEEDALAFYRVIAARAKTWLKPGGTLLLEINEALGPETVEVVRNAGFEEVELRKDLNGRDRMVRGK